MKRSACVILIRKGRIAVIESKKRNGAYELPGGKEEPGETPAQNAARECREEVCVEPEIVTELLQEMDVGGYLCSTFLGRIRDDQEIASSVEGEARWVTPEELLTGTYSEHSRKWLALKIIQEMLSA